jgi:dienelactone hydrolase
MVLWFASVWLCIGWMTPQLRKLADKAAAAGYLAIVPDYMHGDPFKPSPEGGRAGFAEWIVKHHPEGGVEVTKEMVKIIKSKGISAVGLAGFCWGCINCLIPTLPFCLC